MLLDIILWSIGLLNQVARITYRPLHPIASVSFPFSVLQPNSGKPADCCDALSQRSSALLIVRDCPGTAPIVQCTDPPQTRDR
jgi:hypothetical protein